MVYQGKYLVMRVNSGRELPAHELLAAQDGLVPYTPFVKMHQRLTAEDRKNRVRRREYAVAAWKGWLLFAIEGDTDRAMHTLRALQDKRSYLGPVQVRQTQDGLVPFLVPAAQVHAAGRSYDPRRDARKNQSRLYAQSVVIPTFDAGAAAQISEGPFGGIAVEVVEQDGADVVVAFPMFGGTRVVTVQAVDLQEVA